MLHDPQRARLLEREATIMVALNDAPDAPVVGWAAAAKAAGCSKAQVRRLVAKGTLQCTRDDLGRHVFDAADLKALRPSGGRGAAAEQVIEPSHGPAPESRVEAVMSSSPTDGEVAALVFGAFDVGSALTAIVVEHAVEPSTVGRLYAEWRKLKEVDLSAPSVPAALAALTTRLEELEEVLEELDADVAARLKELGGSLAWCVRQIRDAPLSGLRTRWACECGGSGTVAAKVECTACGLATSLGWYPEEGGG